MPAKNPRLTAVVESAVYDWLVRRAGRSGGSMSQAVRDVLREAYDLDEETHWAKVGEERLASFRRSAAKPHATFWKGKA